MPQPVGRIAQPVPPAQNVSLSHQSESVEQEHVVRLFIKLPASLLNFVAAVLPVRINPASAVLKIASASPLSESKSAVLKVEIAVVALESCS